MQYGEDGGNELPELKQLIEKLLRKVTSLEQRMAEPQEILPNRVYRPEHAARLLGIDSVRRSQTISSIPDLPKTRIGPNGGCLGYHGSDLLEFIDRRKEA